MSKQMTVDQLLEKLSSISQSGHGDMLICLGENYPLLEDAIHDKSYSLFNASSTDTLLSSSII